MQEQKHKAMNEDDKVKPEKCQCCGKNEAAPKHSCPYAYEMYNDEDSTCNCCEDCEEQCNAEI